MTTTTRNVGIGFPLSDNNKILDGRNNYINDTIFYATSSNTQENQNYTVNLRNNTTDLRDSHTIDINENRKKPN